MLIIIGFIVVLLAVFGGFAIGGGHLAALFQPNELLMIAGAAIGAFIIGNDKESILLSSAMIKKVSSQR